MGAWINYTDEELAWIKACSDLPRAELHQLFQQIFGRHDVSQQNLKAMCKRKGWLTGRTGRFTKGQVSHNAGKKGLRYAGSEKGWFKAGQRPQSAKPIGYEMVDRDGYVQVCVSEPNPWTGAATRMVHKHRRLWELAKGPVPEGHRLKCLDGDKTNCDPSNWDAIPMALAPRLNGRFGRGYDAAPAEIKPTILAIAKLEHAARVARRAKDGAR